MLTIPLQPEANQTLNTIVAGQPATLKVYQRSTGLFVDLYVNDALIIGGVIAHDKTMIVREPYLGFAGDLSIVDTQGSEDPYYAGLGSRWAMLYFGADELAAAGVG